MDDFSALAARIAVSVGQLRGCIILTRDGLVVGSFPSSDESPVQRAWLRFAALGDPEKGFVEFGDEMWVYVRRGPYAAFALAGTGARPGLVMDQLQQLLLTAEEARAKRDAVRLPDVAEAPKSKPRTPLHRGTGQPAQPPSLTRVEAPPAGPVSRSPAPSEQASPQSSERHARPLSWILAPEGESPPPARPERRPVSWILAPQEDEPTPLTPAEGRSENRTWILPPQEQVTQELSALLSLAPVTAPAPNAPPVPAPHPVSLPDLDPDLLPEPAPEPASSPDPVSVPNTGAELPELAPEPDLDPELEPDPEPASLPQPDPEPDADSDPELDAGIEPEPELHAGIEQQDGEVDRFLLAQEFSRLLEDPGSADESG